MEMKMKTNIPVLEASYNNQELHEYVGNPLIEALPSIVTDRLKFSRAIASSPNIKQQDLLLHPRIRLHAVVKLLDGGFFHPLPMHLNLESKISLMIRAGYVKRNPASNFDKTLLQKNYILSQGGEPNTAIFPTTDRSVQSTLLLGCSGSGKTTSVKKILSTYPQHIVHPKFNMIQQLTYLIVECPFDGNVKSLCTNFFEAIDAAIGTNYYSKYGEQVRIGEKPMLQAMKQIALNHHLGMLVIDEIQHLQDSADNRDELLRFFTDMTNTLGIPILLIGTPKAHGIIKDFRGARRGIGFGNMKWGISRTENDFNQWSRFIKRLWKFQWISGATQEPTSEIIEHIFALSQGIIDITVKLFVIAQLRAIVSGNEVLSIALFNTVYEEEMHGVHQMLDALRSGNETEIAKYSDLTMPKVDIDSIVDNMAHDMPEHEEQPSSANGELEVMLKMLKIDIDQHVGEIARIKSEQPDVENSEIVQLLIAEIHSNKKMAKSIAENKNKKNDNVIKPNLWHKLDHDDLRYLMSQSDTTSAMHRNMKDAGLIAKLV